MPELPEVETTRLGITPHIQGQAIGHIIVRQPQLRWLIPNDLTEQLVNIKIDTVDRRGKYLLFSTAIGTVIIHLGMSGSLRILSNVTEPMKHDHVDFVFKNGTILRFNDPRRFGAILFTSSPASHHALLKNLGVEPLTPDFDSNLIYKLSKNRLTPVKSFIMNSHIVVGVGNIYANEALFSAGIHPGRQAGTISLSRYGLLVDAIKQVLQSAINQGGTTLRNFVNESGNPGYFKQELNVYGRAGLPCKSCLEPLQEIRITNRTTVFCPVCQK